MKEPTSDVSSSASPLDRGHRAMLRRVGTVVGIVLVLAALWNVWRDAAIRDSLARAAARPDWVALAALVIANLATQVLTSGVFWTLTRRHGRVSFSEMNALVATSTLGNFIPMQAGSIGRIAYHRSMHGIPVRTSLIIILQAMSGTAVAISAVGAVALLAVGAGLPWWSAALVAVVWIPLAFHHPWQPFAVMMILRSVEIMAWALHAWAAFRLSGWAIEPQTAIATALIASAANLVPFVGNGLGIREWAVAMAAPLIGGYERDAGLAAELVGRGVDMMVAIPLGLLGFAALMRRVRGAVKGADR